MVLPATNELLRKKALAVAKKKDWVPKSVHDTSNLVTDEVLTLFVLLMEQEKLLATKKM